MITTWLSLRRILTAVLATIFLVAVHGCVGPGAPGAADLTPLPEQPPTKPPKSQVQPVGPVQQLPDTPINEPPNKPSKQRLSKIRTLAEPKPLQNMNAQVGVSALQRQIDVVAEAAGLLKSIKIPFGHDARSPDNVTMSDDDRRLSFYLGVRGEGNARDQPPYKLFIVGPKLVDANGQPLSVKDNWRRFFDSDRNVVYPINHIENLGKEIDEKSIEYEGRAFNVPRITALPEPQLVELYDQTVDNKLGELQREQMERITKTERLVNSSPSKETLEATLNLIPKRFHELDFAKVEFPLKLKSLQREIASLLTKEDVFVPRGLPKIPWRESNLYLAFTALRDDSDFGTLKSLHALEAAEILVGVWKARMHELRVICEGILGKPPNAVLGRSEWNAVKEKSVSQQATQRRFQNQGCISASAKLTISSATRCLEHFIRKSCIKKIDVLLEQGKEIEDGLGAQKETIASAQGTSYETSFEQLINKLTEKVNPAQPQ